MFGKRAQILDLFSQIEANLHENERLIYPKCYFRQDLFVGAELNSLYNRLVDIIKKHKGVVTQNMEDADHVIYPPSVDEVATNNSNSNQWIRVLKKDTRRDSILVHKLFTPDSHDEWIANLDIDDDVAGLNDSSNNASGSEVWEVTSQWLLDTDLYNEWMNQEDYEVDAEQTNNDGKVRLKKPPKMRKTLDDVIKKPHNKNSKRSPSPTPPLNKKSKTATLTRKRKHEEISTSNSKDKENGDTTSEDLTKNMDAPMAQPHVEEVHMPKNVNVKKEGTDYQPYRNGTLIDLDEENEDKKVRKKNLILRHIDIIRFLT